MKKASLLAGAAAASLLAAGIAPAMAQDSPFKDVSTDHWAYEAIKKVAGEKLMIGDPDGSFNGRRALTRYELAIVLSRLLDYLDSRYVRLPGNQGGISRADLDAALSGYVSKSEFESALAQKANKSDLAGLAKQSDVDALRRLISEFQTELTAIGVDVDGLKKRVAALEGRVKNIEDALRRMPKISGAANAYSRSNYRTGTGVTGLRDKDGFVVTKGPGTRGGALADTLFLHDLDVNVRATPSDNTTFEATLNFGNYLSYLGSVTGFTGQRSNRGVVGSPTPVNQTQANTVYKLVGTVGTRVPFLGSTQIQVGRIPTQVTPYSFKNIDADFYFNNSKTDSGDFPVDGVQAAFNVGPVKFTGLAAKVDPIQFVSDFANGYGIVAGAQTAGYGFNATGARGNFTGLGGNRGGMVVEQMGGGHLTFNLGPVNVGGTYLVFGGQQQAGTPFLPFDQVNVYGGSVGFKIFGFPINGEYSKSDTLGVNGVIDNGDRDTVLKNNNDAYDVSTAYGLGSISIKGGYRYVAPYFAAPGNWARVGSYQNPTDIKGGYGTINWNLTSKIQVMGGGQFYQGTGKSVGNGGLTTNQKLNNYSAAIRLGLGSASTVEVGGEVTEYNLGFFNGAKPQERFYNISFGHQFNPATSFRLLYQIADFDGKNTGFDTVGNIQRGGIVAGQFSVRF